MGDIALVTRKKPGPKPKNEMREFKPNEEQKKFIIDVGSDDEVRQMILGLLCKCNSKTYGRDITFRELVIYSFSKITDKDIPKIQESSLTPREKAEKVVADYNQKHGSNLTLEEYILTRDGKN